MLAEAEMGSGREQMHHLLPPACLPKVSNPPAVDLQEPFPALTDASNLNLEPWTFRA